MPLNTCGSPCYWWQGALRLSLDLHNPKPRPHVHEVLDEGGHNAYELEGDDDVFIV